MTIREWCNEHRGIAGSALVIFVLVAIGSVVYQLMGQRHRVLTQAPDMFFSIDDGKTYFAAPGDNVPPFDHQGQVAVEADVYECGGKRFVGYLERYTPEAHQAMIEHRATIEQRIYGRELKKPGNSAWVSTRDLKGSAMIADVHCPDGSTDSPEPIEP